MSGASPDEKLPIITQTLKKETSKVAVESSGTQIPLNTPERDVLGKETDTTARETVVSLYWTVT